MVVLSRLLAAESFVKPRQYTLPQKGAFPRAWLQVGVASWVLACAGLVVVYYFGMPTPDIRHNARCLVHSRYRQFAANNGVDTYLERNMRQQIRGFHFNEKKMREKAEYGAENEERLRVDVNN